MEASNNHGNRTSPAGESREDFAAPLKLQLEVTLPPALGGELRSLRRAFERFTEVMERWLESSLANPGMAPPPAMPWATPPPRAPQPAPLPPAPAAPASPPPSLDRKPILPDEMPLLLVEDSPPVSAVSPSRDTETKKPAAEPISEIRPKITPIIETTAAENDAAAERAASKAHLGERYRAIGHKEKALVYYREALDLDPDCTQAYLGRASIYIEQGRFNEALLDCNAALKREPERAVLYVLRGLVHARLGNGKRALDEAEDAIRCDPRLPSAYMLRGNVRFKNGMRGEALADVKTAIRLRPNDAKFYAELARMLAQTGQHEQAARIYAKVLELSPNSHEARLQRAEALRQAGQASAAEAELTEYLRRRPRTAAAHYQRGLCRLAQRQYPQAVADFDKAIDLKPDDKAAYEAKQKTLQQWEGTARQTRSRGGSAATVALAATANDAPLALPTRPEPVLPKPMPVKPSPAQTKPRRPPPRRRRDDDDDEPSRWLRPAKWACAIVVVGMLGFGGFRLLADFIHLREYKPDEGPPPSAQLSADELFQRFSGQPAAAKAELTDRYLEVRGVVLRHFDDKDPPVVLLAVTRAKATVNCTLQANPNLYQQMMLSRIDGGCHATIVGQCKGLQGNAVSLSECRIVKVTKGDRGVRP
jgi:tetratricopeptide (TPR) repeat protein